MTTGVVELCQQPQITRPQLVERSKLEQDRIVAILLGRWIPSTVIPTPPL